MSETKAADGLVGLFVLTCMVSTGHVVYMGKIVSRVKWAGAVIVEVMSPEFEVMNKALVSVETLFAGGGEPYSVLFNSLEEMQSKLKKVPNKTGGADIHRLHPSGPLQ